MRAGSTPELRGNNIHIWTLRTRASERAVAGLRSVLSEYETDRAARMRSGHQRDSFIAVRGVLRRILGGYLDCDPAAIQFEYGPNGKPSVASDREVHFNLTHSGDLAAVAVSCGCPLGIDLEQIIPIPNMRQLIERFFSPEEAAEIQFLPAVEQEQAFFRCWTRKEAYIKAIGDRLFAFNNSCATVRPDQPARFLRIDGDPDTAASWQLHDLSVGPGYAAALAYRGPARVLFPLRMANPEEFLCAE